MFNAFTQRKKIEEEKFSNKVERIKLLSHRNNNSKSMSSIKRAIAWAEKNKDNAVSEILQKGTGCYIPETFYQFRNHSEKGNVYLRHYVPDKQRIIITTREYFQRNYIKEPYNPKEPNIRKDLWVRVKAKENQFTDHLMFPLLASRNNLIELEFQ